MQFLPLKQYGQSQEAERNFPPSSPTDEYEFIGNEAIDLEDYILKDMDEKADKYHLGEYYSDTLQLLGYKDKDGLYMVYGELW